MDVSAKDVTQVSGPDALFRFRGTGDVGPLLGRRGAGMHEEDIVVSDSERQAAEERALLFAELSASPGNGGLCIIIQGIVGTADRSRIVVAKDHHCAVRRMRFDQIEHGHRIRSVADKVSEKCVAIRPERLCVGKTGGYGLQVAVYVGEQGQLHRDPALGASAERQ